MTGSDRPSVAVIGTGGTIASVGGDGLELVRYIDRRQMLSIDELLARTPELAKVADVTPITYRELQSPAIGPEDWIELVEQVDRLVTERRGLDGIVITHGTATLEETAYFLNLALKVEIPVVLVGAQRPATAVSGDGALNLVNAVRTAGSPRARGMGVMIVLNDEIQAAREGTKTSTLRLQTFRTPDFGALGHADADDIVFYRAPLRRHAPHTEFDVRGRDALPRVDIVHAYAGADGTAIRGFVEAGAQGIVAAGFAPGLVPPAQLEALAEAARAGVLVAHGSRVGSGRIPALGKSHAPGSVTTDNLTPQKARILLMLGLARTRDPVELQRMFDTTERGGSTPAHSKAG